MQNATNVSEPSSSGCWGVGRPGEHVAGHQPCAQFSTWGTGRRTALHSLQSTFSDVRCWQDIAYCYLLLVQTEHGGPKTESGRSGLTRRLQGTTRIGAGSAVSQACSSIPRAASRGRQGALLGSPCHLGMTLFSSPGGAQRGIKEAEPVPGALGRPKGQKGFTIAPSLGPALPLGPFRCPGMPGH